MKIPNFSTSDPNPKLDVIDLSGAIRAIWGGSSGIQF